MQPLVIPNSMDKHRLQGPKQAFDFILALPDQSQRQELERFISDGFNKCYEANVESFLPLLFGIKTKQLRAAVGVRRATEPLFLEQYLKSDVITTLRQLGMPADEYQIAELGNLYSRSHRFTLPLIMTVVMGLYLKDVRYLVFSATEKVRELLSGFGFPMTYLADADPMRLTERPNEWGSYYEQLPKVMALDVEASVFIAHQTPELCDVLSIVHGHSKQLLSSLEAI
ncbi:thermostable hemolysin [Marinomonas balearica]|uniref:Thermostable hemolysin n=1 Tax=Marinomonas balearica TaxID=491947 RepID=A0A4R6MAX7_9GAMM|nr:thermostable hemolysin [Marinomonas balearica]TDO98711.1 thermostable hemolysin [Marinomonas balearica]